MKPGAPQVYDDVPDNIALDYHFGDSGQSRRGLRQGRACTPSSPIINQRLVVNAMEPRAAIGEYDAANEQMDAAFVRARACIGMKTTLLDILARRPTRCACSPAMSAARSA